MVTTRCPAPGDFVAGYRLLRRVGEGGMGVVFEARNGGDPTLALKVLRPEKAAEEPEVLAFREEARATAAVDHECVVTVHECGVEYGVHYLVMEFVDGPPLDRLLAARGRLDWRLSARIAIQVARALRHAHRQGWIHRDVKPGNILLFRDGRVRLTDFGIVKDIGSLKGFLVGGRRVGTAAYASPEQCLGKRLGPATDVYSLGATLYHMVCGRPPFAGGGPRLVAAKHVKLAPTPPSSLVKGVPKPLSNTIEKMLAKRPTARLSSMGAVIRHLEAILEGRVPVGLSPGRNGGRSARLRR
jgi:serine/threonine-protein kinase